MKVLIEGLGLTAGGGKAGLMRLLPALAAHSEHTFVALLVDLPEFVCLARPNLKLMLRPKPASLLAREIYLQRTVPKICADERVDALLCLGNFAPRRNSVPAVVLLHNAHYVSADVRTMASSTLRERLITWYGRRTLHRLPANVRLVVQTEVMRQRVLSTCRVPASRVTVIPDGDGLPPVAGTSGISRTPDAKAGEGKPFTFLCLARYYPHKNLEALVEAFRELRAPSARGVRCLLTIDADQHPGARRLLRRIEAERMEHVLVNIGPVPAERLAAVYASADAFILPTLLESFGRTYLEAMRFGLPILTSDRDFARHACGDAALYFNPLDPRSIACSMARIMDAPELRARLALQGQRAVARVPTWEEIAGRFVSVLEQVATGSSRLSARPPQVAARAAARPLAS